MAGKVTYLHGAHPSSTGCIVQPVYICEKTKSEIEHALKRVLTDVEKSTIEDDLSLYRSLREEHNGGAITIQDVKRTLAGISKLDSKKAVKAYSNCDSKSENLILEALYVELGVSGILKPSGDSISRAALSALTRLEKTDGRPKKSYQKSLADYVVKCWGTLTNDSAKNQPPLRFGVALFEVAGEYLEKTGVAKLIKESVRNKAL